MSEEEEEEIPLGVRYIRAVIKLLEKQVEGLREEEDYYREKLANAMKAMEIAKKRENGGKLTEEEAKIAMSVTCYGHIAYCCGLEKKCPFRNMALSALGITEEQFKEMKERKVEEGMRELGVLA